MFCQSSLSLRDSFNAEIHLEDETILHSESWEHYCIQGFRESGAVAHYQVCWLSIGNDRSLANNPFTNGLTNLNRLYCWFQLCIGCHPEKMNSERWWSWPVVEFKCGKRCTLNSLFFPVVVSTLSYVQCSFVVFIGITTNKRQFS